MQGTFVKASKRSNLNIVVVPSPPSRKWPRSMSSLRTEISLAQVDAKPMTSYPVRARGPAEYGVIVPLSANLPSVVQQPGTSDPPQSASMTIWTPTSPTMISTTPLPTYPFRLAETDTLVRHSRMILSRAETCLTNRSRSEQLRLSIVLGSLVKDTRVCVGAGTTR